MSSDSKLITGFVAGALVGVAAALLLAPTTGSEARSIVTTRAGELRRRATELGQRAGSYASNLRNRGDDSGEEYAESDGEYSRSS